MTDTIDDGGAAFPHPWNADMGWSPRDAPGGMSLRDYFAAAALTGMMANPNRKNNSSALATMHATEAYEIADAMLAARKAKP